MLLIAAAPPEVLGRRRRRRSLLHPPCPLSPVLWSPPIPPTKSVISSSFSPQSLLDLVQPGAPGSPGGADPFVQPLVVWWDRGGCAEALVMFWIISSSSSSHQILRFSYRFISGFFLFFFFTFSFFIVAPQRFQLLHRGQQALFSGEHPGKMRSESEVL